MLAHQLNPAEIIILFAVSASAVTDMTRRRIYNVVTFPTMAAGIITNGVMGYFAGGWHEAIARLFWASFGLMLGLAITMLPNHRKGKPLLAGGDAKMWGAVGACLLPLKMLICWFYFSLAYGVISVVLILKALRLSKNKSAEINAKTEVTAARKALIPVCPAIAVGTYSGIFFDKELMHFMGLNWY